MITTVAELRMMADFMMLSKAAKEQVSILMPAMVEAAEGGAKGLCARTKLGKDVTLLGSTIWFFEESGFTVHEDGKITWKF